MNTIDDDIEVLVTRSGRWWAIRFPTMPTVFSQCRRLEQVDEFAREAIALALDCDPRSVTLDVHVEPPADLADLIAESVEAFTAAREANVRAAATRAAAARALAANGFPTRDIGALLGISHQRVSQLLAHTG